MIADTLYCRGYRIMAIISAFQAEDAGSIPATRSTKKTLFKNSVFFI